MAFFRKWKTHYRHKKFKSDDIVDSNEDWGLDKAIKDGNNIEDIKVDFGSLEADNEDEHLAAANGFDDERILFASYDIKYLGCTPIEVKRSEKATTEAIKTVIANSKAGGRKNKNQKRVKLNVSQDGIEVLDHQTQDTLLRFSIYKISYCSVDAAHDHAFSFVSSETNPLTEQEKSSCHVFLCAKRKIAHEITLMVARCFEHAYQHWRDAVVQHAKSQGVTLSNDFGDVASAHAAIDNSKILKEQNAINSQHSNHLHSNGVAKANGSVIAFGVIESKAEVHQVQQQQPQQQRRDANERSSDNNLLIDLAAADTDIRKFLQNTWVSFDDDVRDGMPIVAC